MNTYQSCGKILLNNSKITVKIKTNLPVLLKGGNYAYVSYHNISNESMFGLLGVLVVNGEPNLDLNKYNSVNQLVRVDPNELVLNELRPLGDGKSFDTIQKGDVIHFVCFHDDKFEATDSELMKFQESLPKIPIDREPKVGNGGILTFEGCQ